MPVNSLILPTLPVSEVLNQLHQTLAQHHELVLEAPPGAGKTTLVPLAILQQQTQQAQQSWLHRQRIVVLEPRRMAARAAALRMASLLDEPVGHTVGYRIRQETRISEHTRIEVITEGILTRMLLQDPALDDVGLLIFDEFHERSMDADFGLALALQGRQVFRETDNPLRLMVMSATLNGAAIANLLGRPSPTNPSLIDKAPIIRSAGKMYPVDLIYSGARRYGEDIVERVTNTLPTILAKHSGNLLVFLPGQGEINRVMQRLRSALSAQELDSTVILPLYGALPLRDQLRAIEPLAPDKSSHAQSLPRQQATKRKIVLATDIAETSLTIDGITVVVDAGLCREPRFDPATGMTRLQTRRISRDSSVQRMGRAGRQAAGCCYRLWSEEQQQQLAQHSTPQIVQADLAPLVLQLLAWGVDDINELTWLDTPAPGPLGQALDILASLGAISHANKSGDYRLSTLPPAPALRDWRLTPHGTSMVTMPAHPRLAHMLLCSARYQQTESAASLAALLSDRSPLNHGTDRTMGADVSQQLAVVMGDLPCHSRHKAWLKRTRHQAKTFKQLIDNSALSENNANQQATTQAATSIPIPIDTPLKSENVPGFLLACAYPDRIAHRKPDSKHHYRLSNGRTAILDQKDALTNSEWLAVAEVGGTLNNNGKSSNDRIFSASTFDPRLFDNSLTSLINEQDTVLWDEKADRFIAERVRSTGKLVIARKRIDNIPAAAKQIALIALIKKRGLDLLPWSKTTRQWQARVMLLHDLEIEQLNDTGNQAQSQPPQWPDVSEQQLLLTVEQWLGPYLGPVSKISDFQKLDLPTILNGLLPWPLPQQLQELAPTTITVPSGSRITIDYTERPPVLRVKLQEMFGCQITPAIANGQVKLMLHLLSPAQRPLQVTRDLAGFWHSSYLEVKKEMKGRYPKHAWPDNPLQTPPTKFTKRRSS